MIGDKIKKLREINKMTQGELASKVDTDSTTISRWETNRVKPGQKYIVKLANALHTTADYLLTGTANEEVDVKRGEESFVKESEKLNHGMLSFTLKDGTKVDMPPTRESYDFLEKIISRAAKVAVL